MNAEILDKFKYHDLIVGIDEVGRGPVAGPVTVAAFGIEKTHYLEVLEKIKGITDSKKLTEKKREFFASEMRLLHKQGKVSIAVSSVGAKKIIEKGIVPAIQAALNRSLQKLIENSQKPFVYLDGSLSAADKYDQEVIIKGDSKNWLIGAASVVAKVVRDNYMKQKALEYPEYGFENHKGYATKAHYEKIKKHGMCDLHRKSWVKI